MADVDCQYAYAWPPPSEFAIDISVARNPGRGQPAGRAQWPLWWPGGPPPGPFASAPARAMGRRWSGDINALFYVFWSMIMITRVRGRALQRDLSFGWDQPLPGRTAQFGEDLPIREAGPNRESQAGWERSGPLKPALRSGPGL